ncbi:DUF3000 domain-containing protein [Streptomyces sp. DSM 44915]|uniref:DUF3000 domain-containing protein n=1 Tax=Streptomyces chisholmiae TaxID=3075540 RepID=A0ABU2JNJ2_9ACTN|nr:DUF3000 domain-containing protein [Streptomyces sp. DSM 44915]MDT0266289.1 DUF3000 domain-containing protein [Streptomyces sp. DSM 44915]
MSDPGGGAPSAFQQAVAALDAARPRPEVTLSPLPPPRRLAPYAHALGAAVSAGGEELADGRFVLLHDPAGEESWGGDFRVVTLTRADLEPDVAADPLLPEVAWSWLTEALQARALPRDVPSGTVTRADSAFFGGLAQRPGRAELELRASWTPAEPADVGAHLLAWCGLLAQCAGLPPESSGTPVTALPRRRGPRPG